MYLQAAWTAFTPTWTATTTNPVIGNGTIVGRYNRVGKSMTSDFAITMGSTTGFGAGQYKVSIPFAARALGTNVRRQYDVDIADVSAGTGYPAIAQLSSTLDANNVFLTTNASPLGALGPTAPITFAVGDTISGVLVWEAA